MKVDNLYLELRSGRVLIEDLSFTLGKGERLAMIGEEGNGKSSLLSCLMGRCPKHIKMRGQIDAGSHRIGMFTQQLPASWMEASLLQFFLCDSPSEEIDWSRAERLKEVSKFLSFFDMDPTVLESARSLASFSGGEKVKLRLSKLLVEDPDLWLLDEPTNDLDLKTLLWLEDVILSIPKPMLIVSHDISFLAQVATSILHLENPQGKRSPRWTYSALGYEDYMESRNMALDKQLRLYFSEQRKFKASMQKLQQQKSAVRSAQEKIKDSSARRVLNKKMKNVLAVKKRLEEDLQEELPHVELPIHLPFQKIQVPKGQGILDLEIAPFKIGERVLSQRITLQVQAGEKVFILGDNGSGKTTLLKAIQKELESKGHRPFALFPQNYLEEFLAGETPEDYLDRHVEDRKLSRIQLGSLRLTPEEMKKEIKDLSSGQQAKVILAKLVLSGAPLILADEPTRNLSALSTPVLIRELRHYGGTMIVISHDRALIHEVATRVLQLTENGLEELSSV